MTMTMTLSFHLTMRFNKFKTKNLGKFCSVSNLVKMVQYQKIQLFLLSWFSSTIFDDRKSTLDEMNQNGFIVHNSSSTGHE